MKTKILISIIFSLCFITGILYGQNKELNKRLNKLKLEEKINYNKKIKEWMPPYKIPEVKKPKNGWENRMGK